MKKSILNNPAAQQPTPEADDLLTPTNESIEPTRASFCYVDLTTALNSYQNNFLSMPSPMVIRNIQEALSPYEDNSPTISNPEEKPTQAQSKCCLKLFCWKKNPPKTIENLRKAFNSKS